MTTNGQVSVTKVRPFGEIGHLQHTDTGFVFFPDVLPDRREEYLDFLLRAIYSRSRLFWLVWTGPDSPTFPIDYGRLVSIYGGYVVDMEGHPIGHYMPILDGECQHAGLARTSP